MDENFENLDSPNEEVAPESEPKDVGLPADEPEVEPQDAPEEDVEALRQRNQELYEQLRKAKGFQRDKTGKWVKPEPKVEEVKPAKDSDITLTELHSLLKANVPEEDTNDVRLFARSHGITITEALKDERCKAILRASAEIRKTSEAAAISGGRRGSLKPTGEQLIEKARKGELPITQEGMAEVSRARIEAKLAARRADTQR
jgi:hypothetical protein